METVSGVELLVTELTTGVVIRAERVTNGVKETIEGRVTRIDKVLDGRYHVVIGESFRVVVAYDGSPMWRFVLVSPEWWPPEPGALLELHGSVAPGPFGVFRHPVKGTLTVGRVIEWRDLEEVIEWPWKRLETGRKSGS